MSNAKLAIKAGFGSDACFGGAQEYSGDEWIQKMAQYLDQKNQLHLWRAGWDVQTLRLG